MAKKLKKKVNRASVNEANRQLKSAERNAQKSPVSTKATISILAKGTKQYERNEKRRQEDKPSARFKSARSVKFKTIRMRANQKEDSVNIVARSNNGWAQVIKFSDAGLVEAKSAMHTVPIMAGGKKKLYMKPLSSVRQPVQVRCSCPDYVHTFAFYNRKKLEALVFRRLKPYKRKTKTQPKRNPKKIPGMCKHLIQLNAMLIRKRYVK